MVGESKTSRASQGSSGLGLAESETVEMLKNKDSHIISKKNVDYQKKNIVGDVDPSYEKFLEMIMAAEQPYLQQPEGCALTHASKRTKSTDADKNKGKTKIVAEGGLLSKGHVKVNNSGKNMTAKRGLLSRGLHVDINIGKKNLLDHCKFGSNDICYSISSSSESLSSDSSSNDEDVQMQQQAYPVKRGPHYGGSYLC